MNKKIINISRKKLNLGNTVLEPLKPVVLKESQLTNSVLKAIQVYENLKFIKVFDVEEQPLLYTQLAEYKQEVELKTQQLNNINSEQDSKQTKSTTTKRKSSSKKQVQDEKQEEEQKEQREGEEVNA